MAFSCIPGGLERSTPGTKAFGMETTQTWIEILRCRLCAATGVAWLRHDGDGMIIINMLPAGFRAVSTEYGDTFFCEACNLPAGTSLK